MNKVKQTRPGHVGLEVVFEKYQEEECLCIYSLEAYIDRTKDLRDKSKLFISYKKPHGPLSRDTISRWIKAVLTASGVKQMYLKLIPLEQQLLRMPAINVYPSSRS
ncbi:hypothetical protein HOLleu_36959 [Holothuria leucospilota]|uniref:Uncharacterized protein n=1 Tax=Holothuria leucospilota TaxID=206669 RepID=A0A9Q0YMX8_HOLLE|nr:hypothetical protein HOLleu_36959 [Holothuria leucospilota]